MIGGIWRSLKSVMTRLPNLFKRCSLGFMTMLKNLRRFCYNENEINTFYVYITLRNLYYSNLKGDKLTFVEEVKDYMVNEYELPKYLEASKKEHLEKYLTMLILLSILGIGTTERCLNYITELICQCEIYRVRPK